MTKVIAHPAQRSGQLVEEPVNTNSSCTGLASVVSGVTSHTSGRKFVAEESMEQSIGGRVEQQQIVCAQTLARDQRSLAVGLKLGNEVEGEYIFSAKRLPRGARVQHALSRYE